MFLKKGMFFEINYSRINLLITRVWQKWRFGAPQTHLWLIKHWFIASTFVVKIATFAKPETVMRQLKRRQLTDRQIEN